MVWVSGQVFIFRDACEGGTGRVAGVALGALVYSFMRLARASSECIFWVLQLLR